MYMNILLKSITLQVEQAQIDIDYYEMMVSENPGNSYFAALLQRNKERKIRLEKQLEEAKSEEL